MKRPATIVLLFILVAMTACSGSSTYRGKWMAMDGTGAKSEIVFDATNFTVKDSAGEIQKYEYKQNSIEVGSQARIYGITLKSGRQFQIVFPRSGEVNAGLIRDISGAPVYTIGRKEYVTLESLTGL